MNPLQLQLRAVMGLGLLVVALGALLVKLAWVQLVGHVEWEASARSQHWARVETIPAERGDILDRQGRVLARTERFPSVALDPSEIQDPHEQAAVAALLRKELGVPRAELFAALERGSRRFAYVRRHVTDRAAVERLKKAAAEQGLRGIVVLDEPRRVYPGGVLAAHVIGFTDRDGKGLEGMEAMLERRLAGRNGRRVTLRDARSRRIVTAGQPLEPAIAGEVVRLTLDAVVQNFAEEVAHKSFTEFQAKGVVAAVVDVTTGEILGLACRPTFDPNDAGKAPADSRRNRFFTDVLEPGSTFKPVVMAAALDQGAVSPSDSFDTTGGTITIGRRRVREDDHHQYGVLSTAGVIARSSNVGMVMVGQRLGIPRTHAALRLFGFGSKTALAWPGESAGQMTPLREWKEAWTLASVSFGHEIAVTPAQLLMAYASLGNGGERVAPRLLLDAPPAESPVRVVSPEAAAQLLPMMEEVLVSGTARAVRKSEYRGAGKTGTAQKLTTGGHVGSFACVGPVEAPRLAVVVICDEPTKGRGYGSVVAAPFAVDLLRQSLRYLGVEPSCATRAEAPDAATAQAPIVTLDPSEVHPR